MCVYIYNEDFDNSTNTATTQKRLRAEYLNAVNAPHLSFYVLYYNSVDLSSTN